MSSPAPSPSGSSNHQHAQRLVQELLNMRDALMQLSLSLRDWQFEVDKAARLRAEQQASTALERHRLKRSPHQR